MCVASPSSVPLILQFFGYVKPQFRAPALCEGWWVPRNSGSNDNRRQRFIKCRECPVPLRPAKAGRTPQAVQNRPHASCKTERSPNLRKNAELKQMLVSNQGRCYLGKIHLKLSVQEN